MADRPEIIEEWDVPEGVPSPDAWDNAGDMDGVPSPDAWDVPDGVPSPDAWDNAGDMEGVPSPDEWDNAGDMEGVPSPDEWDAPDGVPSPDEWDDSEESEYSEDDLTITNLYEKYTGSVEEALADDRYFQYMFEMIQAGDNKLHQVNRVLHKVVDEAWLTVVEEGIESIFKIVDKPRRFIATKEEVVPVALAKKISADSVRHLSQNTQFIATNAAGEMQPTKILNVTTEESYDLYENRFVYHLIQRLFAFVDKRTDVIFWATGDETCNVMSMESKVDDAYEQITYKVEMTVKNKQSLVENDTDNMSIFKRIDRVRRMSRVLRQSSFCEIMNGCAKVHSPIQRTNLMMKDPDYRACYKLWQFIESYDEVGFSIEEQDSAMEFDEEYLLQMYINMITNYTVFKSLLESDPRKMHEIAVEKKEPVKPKFIKEIKEEIVDDPNIPDVEIRKVFVEEVTQAQLDAEAALEQEKQHTQDLEQTVNEMQFSMSDLQWQIDSLNEQLQQLSELQARTEEERNSYMQQLSEEQKAHQETKNVAEKEAVKAREAFEAAQAEAQTAMDTFEAEKRSEIEQLQNEKQASIEKAEEEKKAAIELAEREKRASIEKAEAEKKAAIELAEQEKQAEIDAARKYAAEEIAKTRAATDSQIAEMMKKAEAEITAAKDQVEAARQSMAEAETLAGKYQAEADASEERAKAAEASRDAALQEAQTLAATAKDEAESSVISMKKELADTVARIHREAAEQIEQAQKEATEHAAQVEREAAEGITQAENDAAEKIAQAQKEATEHAAQADREAVERITQAENDAAEKIAQAQKEAEEAAKREQRALARAEANSLSHYIRRSLEERRDRKK